MRRQRLFDNMMAVLTSTYQLGKTTGPNCCSAHWSCELLNGRTLHSDQGVSSGDVVSMMMMMMMMMVVVVVVQVAGVRPTTEGGGVLRKLCGRWTYCEGILPASEFVSYDCCYELHTVM